MDVEQSTLRGIDNKVYQIITDYNELDRFIKWLPACGQHEQFYVTLFSRKKYAPGNPACIYDKTQMKRFTATKERLFDKLCQLECRYGSYIGAQDLPVPQEALAVYITINPRDLYKATLRGIKAFADQIEKHTPESIGNPHQEMMNVIQTTPSKSHYQVFDIDDSDITSLSLEAVIRSIIGPRFTLIKTRGGHHLLVPNKHAKDFPHKDWYMKIKSFSDVVGDCLTPIPGTHQGGHTPTIVYNES